MPNFPLPSQFYQVVQWKSKFDTLTTSHTHTLNHSQILEKNLKSSQSQVETLKHEKESNRLENERNLMDKKLWDKKKVDLEKEIVNLREGFRVSEVQNRNYIEEMKRFEQDKKSLTEKNFRVTNNLEVMTLKESKAISAFKVNAGEVEKVKKKIFFHDLLLSFLDNFLHPILPPFLPSLSFPFFLGFSSYHS